jgi:hypothetical protein
MIVAKNQEGKKVHMNYNKRETKILKIREENKIMETVKKS